MRRLKPYLLRIAGVYLYFAHLAVCYSITEFRDAGFAHSELEPLVEALDFLDKQRNKMDELYFTNCMKRGLLYDERVFYPGKEIQNGRLLFDMDEERNFNIPFELRGDKDD